MTVLKWLAMVVAIGYLGGLTVLYFKQRSMLFAIPPVARIAPAGAGLPEAEEQVLTTTDGEKVIVWHVPAKPGHAVFLYFPGNADFLAGRVSRFKSMISDGTGLVALSYRGYAGSSGQPSERGLLQDAAAAYAFTAARYQAERIVVWGFSLGTGVARRAGRRATGRQADSRSALYVDGRCRRLTASYRAGGPVDAGSISFRPAHRARQRPAARHAWRQRSRDPDLLWRAIVRAGP